MTIDHNTTNQLPHNELYIALYSICIVCKLTKLVKTSQIHKKRHLIYTGTQINTEDISSSVHLCGCCDVSVRSFLLYRHITPRMMTKQVPTQGSEMHLLFWIMLLLYRFFSPSLHTQKDDRNELKDYDKAPLKVDKLVRSGHFKLKFWKNVG